MAWTAQPIPYGYGWGKVVRGKLKTSSVWGFGPSGEDFKWIRSQTLPGRVDLLRKWIQEREILNMVHQLRALLTVALYMVLAVSSKAQNCEWSALGSGLPGGVNALVVFDDGSGPALYAGGDFTQTGGMPTATAKWNGTSWSTLPGMNGATQENVYALAIFDDGAGSRLYSGGFRRFGPGDGVNNVSRWNGSSWSTVGSYPAGLVLALSEFDDGSGPKLYAGGLGGSYRWNGSSWVEFGGSEVNEAVRALTVFDDGTGPALYAGGSFTQAGGSPANYIAKYNGLSWSPLGSGLNNWVFSLAVFDDGSGPALFAGGYFTLAGGVPVQGIAKWDGSSWSQVGSGLNGSVYALTVFDDGSGSALFAGGSFNSSGVQVVNNIAKWDGLSWSPLGSGIDGNVASIVTFDDGTGHAFFVAGGFSSAGGVPANRVARWRGPSVAITLEPQDQSLETGDTLTLVAEAVGGMVSYEWSRDGTVLVDDSRISGAATPTLTIADLTVEDAGQYQIRALNSCSEDIAAATVTIREPCFADLDDNDVLNFFDIAAFLAFYQLQFPIADWNGDGVLNFFDFAGYLDAYNDGCP